MIKSLPSQIQYLKDKYAEWKERRAEEAESEEEEVVEGELFTFKTRWHSSLGWGKRIRSGAKWTPPLETGCPFPELRLFVPSRKALFS